MILVADSGSTKCDWLLQQQSSNPLPFYSIGFNPMFHSSDFMVSEIQKNQALMGHASHVTHVYYYGASVSSPDRIEMVKKALQTVFQNAVISAEHDLSGAVRATCGDQPGIACILGTGSNSCYFDGNSIHDHIPALGYILGDEAGGAWFGKELLKHYLYHLLPKEVEQDIQNEGYSKEEIFKRVYKSEGANVFLASFMPIISKHREQVEIENILIQGFADFLKYHVLPFEEHKLYPTHFVGSVGLNFKEELSALCLGLGINTGIFTNEPVHNLFKYHTR